MNRSLFLKLALAGVGGLLSCAKTPSEPSSSTAGTGPTTVTAAAAPAPAAGKEIDLLNVSYDPTRELWRDLNEKFTASYEKEHGRKISIKQSHGGSSTQARAVIDGLEADVVTLATFVDTNAVAQKSLIKEGWQERLPNRSLPYISTVVFVVRKGNPKGVKDWPDLIKPGVELITPNPKTSGNGYLSFFSAWGSVVTRGGSKEDAVKYVTELYKHVPVLDSGARGATTTFVQKKIGDVHLAWENEAQLEVREGKGELELVYPPVSIRAEPHVAVVDANVDRHGTREAAEAYLKFVYTDEGQDIVAKHFYRPTTEAAAKKHAAEFPAIKLFPITDIAKDFLDAHKQFIGEGGVFDSIYKPKG
ncbi:MAG: Sulfate-binding protein precursor [Pseudomonadota bacterium]|jgi:sulfate/thiosulfate transport system substrate-binding protein